MIYVLWGRRALLPRDDDTASTALSRRPKKNCQFGFEFAINILGDRGSLDPRGQVHRHRSSSAHILHGPCVARPGMFLSNGYADACAVARDHDRLSRLREKYRVRRRKDPNIPILFHIFVSHQQSAVKVPRADE